jgi:uncharacterized protein (DUF1810 family)
VKFNCAKAQTKHAPISLIPPLVRGCWRARKRCVNARINATEIFGSPDDLKLRSSATLFASVSAPDSVFHRLLEKFYAGGLDKETLRLVGISNLS